MSIIENKIAVRDLLTISELEIQRFFAKKWIGKQITHFQPQRPGLAFSGYLEYINPARIQVIGKTEYGYLKKIGPKAERSSLEKFFTLNFPAIIFAENLAPSKIFISIASKNQTPILVSALKTPILISRLSTYLFQHFSRKIKIHGVMMDIMGQGVFITGDSGVGKSETALELLNKGYHLICDDVVEFFLNYNNELIGIASPRIKNLMEVRGLGIINIAEIFGSAVILKEKKLDLVIQLEKWDPLKNYDRLGEQLQSFELLGIRVPMMTIPVAPGRNISTIIEIAVRFFISRKILTEK